MDAGGEPLTPEELEFLFGQQGCPVSPECSGERARRFRAKLERMRSDPAERARVERIAREAGAVPREEPDNGIRSFPPEPAPVIRRGPWTLDEIRGLKRVTDDEIRSLLSGTWPLPPPPGEPGALDGRPDPHPARGRGGGFKFTPLPTSPPVPLRTSRSPARRPAPRTRTRPLRT